MSQLLDAEETADRLPYPALVAQLRAVLADPLVQVPERRVYTWHRSSEQAAPTALRSSAARRFLAAP